MNEVKMINHFSVSSLFVEIMFNEVILACGTAFYYCCDGTIYLVSNWHNFSGRHPETKKPLHSQLAVPNKIKVYGHNLTDLSIPELHIYNLLDDENGCTWFEHPIFKSLIDVAVLPVPKSNLNTFDISSAINAIDPYGNSPVEVGDSLFVLGFPFGISGTYNFPIWKAASLASEPALDQENLPLLYIDTATRQGMSGSPVISYRRRTIMCGDGQRCWSKFHSTFVGVYSGRITPKDQLEAQLGKVWKAHCIEEIIKGASSPVFL
ncbi:S1 family peptidase [Candidatus Electronema sp. PJ]|uniref:S1 family peptidase n=1 Tax=Candidatus Electronema sp. PJ TaxID=3401572 RepID=UPI003AA938C3